MSSDDLETALDLISQHADRCHFAGPRDEETTRAAESALGLTLPTSYRRFVLELGAGSAGSQEFYGVISEPFIGPIPDAVWVTLEERKHGLPSDAVIVGDTGMGEWYIVRGGPEGAAVNSPVEILHATEKYDEPTEIAASDFGGFLLDAVRIGLAG